jgi:hypothetical protein
VVLAQGGFQLAAFTVSPGGTSTGDGYTLSATAGQAYAGELTGGGYTLSGGFAGSAAQEQERLFVPILER